MLLGLAVAVLGAFGLDSLRTPEAGALSRRWALWGFALAAVVVGGVSAAVATGAQQTSGGGERARLAWAGAEAAGGVVLVLVARLGRAPGQRPAHRAHTRAPTRRAPDGPHQAVAAVLLVVQSVQLVLFGVSFWSLSSDYFTPTPAVSTLAHTVGDAVVGIGPCRPRPFEAPLSNEPGVRPNANAAYGIHEFAVYEPVLPKAYYQSWTSVTGQQLSPSLRRVGLFCPQITTVAAAASTECTISSSPRALARPAARYGCAPSAARPSTRCPEPLRPPWWRRPDREPRWRPTQRAPRWRPPIRAGRRGGW